MDAHRLCAHCVIAIHCRLNCSTPPLCPKKPPRLTTVLVALRWQQRRAVVATAYLRTISNLPPPPWSDSISCEYVDCEPDPFSTAGAFFCRLSDCSGTTPARQWGRGHRNTAEPEAAESRSEPRDARTRPAGRDGSSGAGAMAGALLRVGGSPRQSESPPPQASTSSFAALPIAPTLGRGRAGCNRVKIKVPKVIILYHQVP